MSGNGSLPPAREYEIIEVRASNEKSDGTPMLTKHGKPMWRTKIQIAERPGIWIDGLTFADPSGWKNTKRSLVLFTEEYRGQQEPKFRVPSSPRANGIANEKLDEMILLLREIRDGLKREQAP